MGNKSDERREGKGKQGMAEFFGEKERISGRLNKLFCFF
jgi:hypothetical protein